MLLARLNITENGKLILQVSLRLNCTSRNHTSNIFLVRHWLMFDRENFSIWNALRLTLIHHFNKNANNYFKCQINAFFYHTFIICMYELCICYVNLCNTCFSSDFGSANFGQQRSNCSWNLVYNSLHSEHSLQMCIRRRSISADTTHPHIHVSKAFF